jgi:type VI secretion system VasD/TssJ family lipoprotein
VFARNHIVAAAVVVAAVLVPGCGSALKEIGYCGTPPLNVNEKGENTPVKVRLYFLKKPDKFTSSAWGDLYPEAKAKEILGGDLVGEPIVFDVFPNDNKVLTFPEVKPEVGHVGVFGLFLKGVEGKPRHVAVDAVQAKSVLFEFTNYTVVTKSR